MPEALQPAPQWRAPKSRRRPVPVPAAHTPSTPNLPTEPAPPEPASELASAELPHAETQAAEQPPTVPAGTADVEPQVLDPYEEFARLAGRQATADAAARRHTDRSSTLPAETLDPESGARSEPDEPVVLPPPAFEPSPLWLASRAGAYPMDIAIPDPPASPAVDVVEVVGVVDVVGDEASPAADPYENFADLARSHATARTAAAAETDGGSEDPSPPGVDTALPGPTPTDGPPRDAASGEAAPSVT